MLSLNPNRFICKGYFRASFVNKSGSLRLIPNELLEYIQQIINGTKTKYIKEFDILLETENFIVPNGIRYEIIETPSTLNVLEIEFSTDLPSIVELFQSVLIETIIIRLDIDLSIEIVKKIKHISTVFNTSKILLKLKKQELSKTILKKLNEVVNIREIYIENKLVEQFNLKVFKKNKERQTDNIVYLEPNKEFLIESMYLNTYLNKRLFIDSFGNIKLEKTLEPLVNIKDITITRLYKLLKSKEIYQFWKLNKHSIDICKDCEYRLSCLDFRVPIKRNKEWYNKHECNYNPYIGKWSHEEDYLTLAECGIISNEHEFSIDHKRIAEINKELWGE